MTLASSHQKPAIGAIIMAAGAGRRMGNRPKSLLQRDGEPLLQRQIRLLAQAGAGVIVVVLGHHAGQIETTLDAIRTVASNQPVDLRTAVNPAPDDGPGSSLRCGLSALPQNLSLVLVALGDQPLLEPEDVGLVIDAWVVREPGIELVVPCHEGQPGHPVAFGPVLRAAVMQAPAAAGVREWRRAHAQQVQLLAANHERHVADVDTPQDLEALALKHGVQLRWAAGQETGP